MSAQPILTVSGLSKSFAGTQALRSVAIDVMPGEAHGLLGQNGSGKSTLIKVLSGVHEPDPGAEVAVNGEPLTFPLAPGESRRCGIGFLHQDLALAPSLSILENLRTEGFQTGFGGRILWQRERASAREALAGLGLRVDPMAPVSTLAPAERAILALARSLAEISHVERGVLVLDEPTAYLPRTDVERLFDAVRETKARGSGVIFVSHRMEEVLAICDRATVLRDGRRVGTVDVRNSSEQEIMHLIVGRQLEELEPPAAAVREDVVLSVRGLSGRVVTDLSLDVHRGEVVGLTGLVGMGHDEVPYLLVGASPAAAGDVAIEGRSMALEPRAALRAGLALLPSDRLRESGVPSATVRENLSLPVLGSYFKSGWLDSRGERSAVQALLDGLGVKPAEPERLLGTLSGGNQQKALLAKWLQLDPKALVLHEPTQGVDVGARRDVIEQIRDGARRGVSTLVVSSEAEDLERLCDRVLVFRDGAVVSSLAGADITKERITERSYARAVAAPSA